MQNWDASGGHNQAALSVSETTQHMTQSSVPGHPALLATNRPRVWGYQMRLPLSPHHTELGAVGAKLRGFSGRDNVPNLFWFVFPKFWGCVCHA